MKNVSINILCIIVSLTILILPIKIEAIPGCCSWHGGEAGCSGNRTLCADGTLSSCPCDGTNSSLGGNSTNNNPKSNSATPLAIIGVVIIYICIWLFGRFIDFYENAKEERKRNQREQKELEYEQIQEELREQKELDVETIISYGNEDFNIIDEIDDQSICRFTSDDLLKIINSNNKNIFHIIDLINDKKSLYTELYIFDKLCCKIIENKKLSSLQNKCVKYLIEKKLINSYEKFFLIILQNQHISLVNYILNNCNDVKFDFRNNYGINKSYTEFIFESLLNINDLSLAEKVAKKKNFSFSIGINLYEKTYEHNDMLKYELLSIFSKNIEHSYINIESIFEREIKLCNSDEEIVKKIDSYLKINSLLKEKGYFLVYLLIKKQSISCIEYLFEKCNNINLDKLIMNSSYEKLNGLTPLTYAIYRKSNKIIEMLLNYGADYNFPDINGDTPLAYVCYLQKPKLIKLFYEKGCRLKKDKDNDSIEYYLKEKVLYLLPFIYVSKLYELTKK